jgi:cytochrome c553
MNKLLTTLFALAVACVTGSVEAQAPAASAPAANAKPAAAAPADARLLEAKTAMCMGCHGIVRYQTTFPEVYKVPMIFGQSAKYIAAALNEYKTGGRKHPTMRGIATSLSDQDIQDLAGYFSSHGKQDAAPLPEKLGKEPNAQVAPLLQKAACVSCHGPNLSKPIDPSYPKIAGQYPDYLFVALKAYKTDNNPDVGRSNPIMGGIAKQFSNTELKALADYVSSLDGEVTVRPENRFR